MTTEQADWRSYLQGIVPGEPVLIGQGMEGAVYALGDGKVAKVWFQRQAPELLRLKEFYEELRVQAIPFQVPEITDVVQVNDRVVSIEQTLNGCTLRDMLKAGKVTREQAQQCMVDVLLALAKTRGGPASRALPVLNEGDGMWAGYAAWRAALTALVRRRVEAYGDQLTASVTDFERKLQQILHVLAHLPSSEDAVIHGDLVPANVLVDPDGSPAAVLDWGFLSTEGDPVFEASVTSAIFDMYGPDAHTADDQLVDILSRKFGYSRKRILFYRAVYSVLTSNVYDPTGQDGHYAWCVHMLDREDVSVALATWADEL